MRTYQDLDHPWWNATVEASDGRVLCGRGITEKQAKQDVTEKLEKVEAFLRLPPEDQLRKLCKGRMSPNAQEAAIKLLAEIVLNPSEGTDERVRRLWNNTMKG